VAQQFAPLQAEEAECGGGEVARNQRTAA